MVETPVIEIPRLEGETTKAYAARVEYLTMGAVRSFDKLVGQKQGKNGVSKSAVENWSVRYGWQRSAQEYDETLATLAAQAHAQQYRDDLEDHRKRYQKAGKDLYAVAASLVTTIAQTMRGRRIIDKDGQVHIIPAMEITTNALSIAARALTTAGDLEAHALRIADLLPKLSDDTDNEQS